MIDETRKDRIRKLARAGRELSHIYDFEEVTVDEQAELEKDDAFQQLLAYDYAAYREDMERQIDSAIMAEMKRGVSATTLRWQYERQFGNTEQHEKKRPSFPFEDTPTDDLRSKAKTAKRFLE